MLRRSLILFAAFSFIVALSATAQEPKGKEKPKETEASKDKEKKADPKTKDKKDDAKADDGKLNLTWKLEKGQEFFQEMKTKTTQNMTVMGMDVSQTQEQTFFFKWTPVEEKDGKWTLTQTIQGVKMTIDIAGNTIQYDSTSTTSTSSALADFFGALVSAEFTLTLDENFKVQSVEGREELINKLTAANKQMEGLLKQILSEEAMKQMADPTFGVVPGKEVSKGESWTHKTELDLGPIGTYANTYTFTYVGKDPEKKGLDRIEVEVDLTYKAPAENKEGLPFQINSADLKNTSEEKGVILYNPETGRVESSKLNIVLQGTLDLTIGGMKTKVDLKQEQETTVNTSESSFLKK